jgi:glutamate racemase
MNDGATDATKAERDERTRRNTNEDRRPIGVFDSGLGGLTVVRALRQRLPGEDVVYLGDTARVPYGTRSTETIVRYARACGRALAIHEIKMLVVACNTVSAVALDALREDLALPVLGVIEPGARAAVAATRTGRIGVLGTASTVASGAYPRAVARFAATAEVVSVAAPLLVPLVEEGWLEGEVTTLVVERYLDALRGASVDTLVLGCTHYPMLRPVIERVARAMLGQHTRVVDSAEATALELDHFLTDRGLRRARGAGGSLEITVTDRPRSFTAVAERFLGHSVGEVEVVDL